MAEASQSTPRARGRGLLWLGIACLFAGIAIYVVQLIIFHRTATPWFLLVTATVGFLFVLLATFRRPNALRVFVLVFVGSLTAMQWYFLLSYVRLPAYSGPAKTGQQLPEFQAKKADGSLFTRADLPGDRATAIVFFRGRW